MTAHDLIALLETHDGDKRVITLDSQDITLDITGIDSYEDALVLVTEELP